MAATISMVAASDPGTLTGAAGRLTTSIDAARNEMAAQRRVLSDLTGSWQGEAADARTRSTSSSHPTAPPNRGEPVVGFAEPGGAESAHRRATPCGQFGSTHGKTYVSEHFFSEVPVPAALWDRATQAIIDVAARYGYADVKSRTENASDDEAKNLTIADGAGGVGCRSDPRSRRADTSRPAAT